VLRKKKKNTFFGKKKQFKVLKIVLTVFVIEITIMGQNVLLKELI